MGSPNKRLMQSLGLASGKDFVEEMKSKVQDLCETVFKEYELSYSSTDEREIGEDGYAFYYYFDWQEKSFVLIANVTFSEGHLRASIWNESNTKFYQLLCSSELHRYYPMQVYMTEQMEDFLLNKWSGDGGVMPARTASSKSSKKEPKTKEDQKKEDRKIAWQMKLAAVFVVMLFGWAAYSRVHSEESFARKCFDNHKGQACYDACVSREGRNFCQTVFGRIIRERITAGKTEKELKAELGLK